MSAAFVLFGAFWGAWAIAASDIEHDLHVSHGTFGLILSGALVGAMVANSVGGVLAERWGTGPLLAASLVVWGALLLVAAVVHARIAFALLLVVSLVVGGLVDVVMNVAATAGLAQSPGALVRFHYRFNAGAALGALVTGVFVAQLVSWRWMIAGVGLAALAIAVRCAGATLPAGEPGERTRVRDAFTLLRTRGLVVVAVAFAVGAMVEGGVNLWGVLFLRTQLKSGLLVGTASAVAGFAVAGLVRVTLGPAASRGGADRGVALGSGAAAGGLVVLALGPYPWLSGLGLVAAAGGISMCWPLLLTRASAASVRPGAVVGSVSAVGYVGLVVGPSIVGALASGIGLRAALLVLAAGSVFVAVSPRLSRSPREVA